MGNTELDDDAVAARQEFVRRLRDDEAVSRVNFSRDGFRVVVVSLEPDAEFRDEWRRTATRLGYTVERVVGDPQRALTEDVWVLRLDDDEDSAGRFGWRNAVGRLRRFVDRLRDRRRDRS